MSDNWIVQNLTNALNTWNAKLAEIWQLVTQSPEAFKGGNVWSVIKGIHGSLVAIGLALLVLFFVMGIVKGVRALPGPGVYRFGFSRKAGALTRKRKATQRAAFPPNLAPAFMSLSSVALSSDASKSTFMVTLFSPHVNIQRRGDTAQSRR